MNQSNLNVENIVSESDVTEIKKAISIKDLAWKIAEAAGDRLAKDIVLLNVEGMSFIADYFVIVTGFSKVQLKAISDSIQDKIFEQFGQNPIHIEGRNDPNWILLDYGDIIVHIFTPEEREFYGLEAFWSGAEKFVFNSDIV